MHELHAAHCQNASWLGEPGAQTQTAASKPAEQPTIPSSAASDSATTSGALPASPSSSQQGSRRYSVPEMLAMREATLGRPALPVPLELHLHQQTAVTSGVDRRVLSSRNGNWNGKASMHHGGNDHVQGLQSNGHVNCGSGRVGRGGPSGAGRQYSTNELLAIREGVQGDAGKDMLKSIEDVMGSRG